MSIVSPSSEYDSKLVNKIEHIIDEIRIVIPGTETLLGFQLAAVFSNGFDALPSDLKYAHLISLFCVAICILLLLTPVAFHRIVEKGKDTNLLHSLGSYMIVAAMFFLALGLSCDIFVVCAIILGSNQLAFVLSSITLLAFIISWFGITAYLAKKS